MPGLIFAIFSLADSINTNKNPLNKHILFHLLITTHLTSIALHQDLTQIISVSLIVSFILIFLLKESNIIA